MNFKTLMRFFISFLVFVCICFWIDVNMDFLRVIIISLPLALIPTFLYPPLKKWYRRKFDKYYKYNKH